MSTWLYLRLARPISLLVAASAILFILAITTEPLWRGTTVAPMSFEAQ